MPVRLGVVFAGVGCLENLAGAVLGPRRLSCGLVPGHLALKLTLGAFLDFLERKAFFLVCLGEQGLEVEGVAIECGRAVGVDGDDGARIELEDLRLVGARELGAHALDLDAKHADGEVHQEARHHAKRDLEQHELHHEAGVSLLGDHQGQHLVGGGEKHREERAERDDATSVEHGRRGREAALGHCAEHGADGGAGGACAGNDLAGLCAGFVFERHEGEIGHEQKRHEAQRVERGVDKAIQEQVQNRASNHCCEMSPSKVSRVYLLRDHHVPIDQKYTCERLFELVDVHINI